MISDSFGTKFTDAPIHRVLGPVRRFMAIEAASGILLVLCAAIALAVANSPWSDAFSTFWETHFRISIGPWEIDESLLHWINDGLMTIFFFVIGLEIKREVVDGELNEVRKAALPLMAAVGGMVAPATLYLLLIGNEGSGHRGWGIPMATDIAFVVGFLAILGRRVPVGLKILLLALAIVDDIGAILVIALFYSDGISLPALLVATTGLGLTVFSHWLGIRSLGVYLLIGIAIWMAMLHSGVHPTVAGVLLGLLTPAQALLPKVTFLDALSASVGEGETEDLPEELKSVGRIKWMATETVSPLERLEKALHPWVAFLIMPLFALANAGVAVELRAVSHPIAWSVALGLIVGKPVGILLLSWLAVTTRLAKLPMGVTWKSIAGAGCLAGIGFTMSLFIASLALNDDVLAAGKIGTLLGSFFSAILGLTLLLIFLPAPPTAAND
jgi:Na+:H+ antiporter, NhaA family